MVDELCGLHCVVAVVERVDWLEVNCSAVVKLKARGVVMGMEVLSPGAVVWSHCWCDVE